MDDDIKESSCMYFGRNFCKKGSKIEIDVISAPSYTE